jgi:hypothetical protein
MTSNTLPTSDNEEIVISSILSVLTNEEKDGIRNLIQKNLQKNNLENSMRVWLFFNSIQLIALPHLPYQADTIWKWNRWIESERLACIEKLKSNSTTMPKVRFDRLHIFFDTLINQDLIFWVNPILERIHPNIDRKVADIL